MKKILTIMGIVCVVASYSVNATGFDKGDRIVVAYELSATQEAQFSSTDNKVADFWAIWGANETTLDYIYMDPSYDGGKHAGNHSQDGFDLTANPPDAATTIRYAYGANGIYLYWAQEDDQFVGVIQTEDMIFRNDAVDFQFDSHSSSDIYANNYRINDFNSLTQNDVQFQQLFGGAGGEPLSWFRRSYYDGSNPNLVPVQVSWADSKTGEFKIEVEIVSVDAYNRIQEWLIPWAQVGNPGLGSKPAVGTQIAHVCHYNDLDGSTTDREDILCWNMGSTYNNLYGPTSPYRWNDIEFGPKVDDVIISAVRPVSRIKTSSRVLSTEYFTISGKRLPLVNNVVKNQGNTLVIKREILENGQIKSTMTGLVK